MVNRRGFLGLASAGATWAASGAMARTAKVPSADGAAAVDRLVALTGDNLPSLMGDYPTLLARLLQEHRQSNDFYLAKGAVSSLESEFAGLLGKEDAVFMPTGTMANQIAIRLLCGERRRVLLLRDSHLYQDEGDAVPVLSGINAVPLDAAVTDLGDAVRAAFLADAESAHAPGVGAISLESPIRRRDGQTVPVEQVDAVSSIARQHGAGLHLDGARLLLMSGSPGFELAAYCRAFDTVYVSLYKYLGAPFGAVLAGSKAMMDKARDMRHVFGGTLFHGWMAALPALEHLHGFPARFASARQAGERLLEALDNMDGIDVERVPHGSNVAFLRLAPQIADGLAERLRARNIFIAQVEHGRLAVTINETMLRQPIPEIVSAFVA